MAWEVASTAAYVGAGRRGRRAATAMAIAVAMMAHGARWTIGVLAFVCAFYAFAVAVRAAPFSARRKRTYVWVACVLAYLVLDELESEPGDVARVGIMNATTFNCYRACRFDLLRVMCFGVECVEESATPDLGKFVRYVLYPPLRAKGPFCFYREFERHQCDHDRRRWLYAVLGDFLTWPGKIRAGLGAIGIRPPAPGKEESVKEFVSRNLGTEAFERLIEPFCSGVYAGDPAALSSVAATGRVQRLEPLGGSLVAGAIMAQKEAAQNKKPRDPRLPEVKGQTVGSFRGGLKTFPEGLAKQLGDDVVKCNWKLVGVSKSAEGGYECAYDTPEGPQTVRTKCLLLTAPAYVAAEMVKDMAPAAATALNKFYYPPVASVTISYKKDSFRLDGTSALPEGGLTGFGQLHPRSQGIRTLGTIYSSSLFKDDKRQPDDEFMILNYIGGARDVAIKDLSEEELVKQVHEDALKTILKPGTPLPKVVGVKVWEKAIPQFNLGHLDVLAEAENALTAADCGEKDGLFLGGNYTAGVALGRCVEFGIEQADEVVAYLNAASKKAVAV